MTLPLASLGTDNRPAAHFTALDTWLNDPNGLLYHNGVYHLFFQNNPSGSTWGNISWGHATSTDLVTWAEHSVAIPAEGGEMAFSGSAVVDLYNSAGFAGPGETALVAIYTAARPPVDGKPGSQAQALAYSVDDGLTWTRYAGNPVLDIGSSEFRDPKVFRYGGAAGHWVMVAVEATDHRVAIYTSHDLKSWTFASHFGPAHATGGVWECPDLFALPIEGETDHRWVLLVSLNPGGIAGGSGTQYFLGAFDGYRFIAENLTDSTNLEDYDWLDFGPDFYAAVSFNDVPDGRRLIIGWASNWLYANETPTGPWRSAMSLVREVTLLRAADGALALRQTPVLPQEGKLRTQSITVPCGPQDTVDVTLSDAAREHHLVITVDGEKRRLTSDRGQSGDVGFHNDFSLRVHAAFPADIDNEIDLLIVVDGTIVEIFAADGRIVLTQQVFPSRPYADLRVRHERTAAFQSTAALLA